MKAKEENLQREREGTVRKLGKNKEISGPEPREDRVFRNRELVSKPAKRLRKHTYKMSAVQ